MRLRIDHGRRPSDAYRFADQPAPAAASADAIRVEAIAALERKQGIARIAAKCAIQRLCGKSQGVERIRVLNSFDFLISPSRSHKA